MGEGRKSKIDFKQWLEKLQQESWQLELIISGFAIFGLFQARGYLFQMHNNMTEVVVATTIPILFMSLTIVLAWHIFVSNLLLHVFVRGLWIGAIGLRYVSGEINYDQLGYNKRFTEHYRKNVGSFDDYIERLERFASVIFAYTFLLCFMLISFAFFMAFLLFFSILLLLIFDRESIMTHGIMIHHPIPVTFLLSLLFLGAVVLFDFMTLGLLKRIKQRHFSSFYFWVSRFMSIITLAFLWHPLLFNFLDSKYTKRLVLFSLPYYFLLLVLLPSLSLEQHGFYPTFTKGSFRFKEQLNKHSVHYQFYDEERERMRKLSNHQPIYGATIPSKRVQGNYLEFFVKAHRSDGLKVREQVKETFPLARTGFLLDNFSTLEYDPSKDLKTDPQDTLAKARINSDFEQNLRQIKGALISFLEVRIDNQKVDNNSIDFDFYLHPDTGDKGLLAYADIEQLPRGRHILSVKKYIARERKNNNQLDSIMVSIPFLKEN